MTVRNHAEIGDGAFFEFLKKKIRISFIEKKHKFYANTDAINNGYELLRLRPLIRSMTSKSSLLISLPPSANLSATFFLWR